MVRRAKRVPKVLVLECAPFSMIGVPWTITDHPLIPPPPPTTTLLINRPVPPTNGTLNLTLPLFPPGEKHTYLPGPKASAKHQFIFTFEV